MNLWSKLKILGKSKDGSRGDLESLNQSSAISNASVNGSVDALAAPAHKYPQERRSPLDSSLKCANDDSDSSPQKGNDIHNANGSEESIVDHLSDPGVYFKPGQDGGVVFTKDYAAGTVDPPSPRAGDQDEYGKELVKGESNESGVRHNDASSVNRMVSLSEASVENALAWSRSMTDYNDDRSSVMHEGHGDLKGKAREGSSRRDVFELWGEDDMEEQEEEEEEDYEDEDLCPRDGGTGQKMGQDFDYDEEEEDEEEEGEVNTRGFEFWQNAAVQSKSMDRTGSGEDGSGQGHDWQEGIYSSMWQNMTGHLETMKDDWADSQAVAERDSLVGGDDDVEVDSDSRASAMSDTALLELQPPVSGQWQVPPWEGEGKDEAKTDAGAEEKPQEEGPGREGEGKKGLGAAEACAPESSVGLPRPVKTSEHNVLASFSDWPVKGAAPAAQEQQERERERGEADETQGGAADGSGEHQPQGAASAPLPAEAAEDRAPDEEPLPGDHFALPPPAADTTVCDTAATGQEPGDTPTDGAPAAAIAEDTATTAEETAAAAAAGGGGGGGEGGGGGGGMAGAASLDPSLSGMARVQQWVSLLPDEAEADPDALPPWASLSQQQQQQQRQQGSGLSPPPSPPAPPNLVPAGLPGPGMGAHSKSMSSSHLHHHHLTHHAGAAPAGAGPGSGVGPGGLGASLGGGGGAAGSSAAQVAEHAARVVKGVDRHAAALYLSMKGLLAVPPLAAFSCLKTLDLSRNSLTSIPAGAFPRTLHIMDLSHNRLWAVEGLRELGRLRVLNLCNNRIARIGHGLAGCVALREVYMGGNKIAEVEGLHRLLKLCVLDLSHNKITSTKALSQLAANYGSLRSLNLLGNPIHVNLGDDAFKRYITGLLPQLLYLNQRPMKALATRDGLADPNARSKALHHHGSRTGSSARTGHRAGSSRRKAAGGGASASSSGLHKAAGAKKSGTGHRSRGTATEAKSSRHHHRR